jgi:hypothetical protein
MWRPETLRYRSGRSLSGYQEPFLGALAVSASRPMVQCARHKRNATACRFSKGLVRLTW